MKFYILVVVGVGFLSSLNVHAKEQAVRFYTKGSLVNAASLPSETSGLVKVFRNKNRHYGANELIQMVTEVAQEVSQEHPKRDRLQIGDVANKNGGSIGKHKSHQNGLDIDIVYYRNNNREQDPSWMGQYVEKFVKNGAVTSNFDIERNWKLLKKFASFPQVERVFVDLSIKRKFCQLYKNSADPMEQRALHIMRPARLHDDHLHLRISCPEKSTRCVPQNPPPPGNGCGNSRMLLDFLEYDLEEEEHGC